MKFSLHIKVECKHSTPGSVEPLALDCPPPFSLFFSLFFRGQWSATLVPTRRRQYYIERRRRRGVTKHPGAPRESILAHNNMGLSSKRESSSAIKHNWKIGELSSLF